jgi:hypothetical protein
MPGEEAGADFRISQKITEAARNKTTGYTLAKDFPVFSLRST